MPKNNLKQFFSTEEFDPDQRSVYKDAHACKTFIEIPRIGLNTVSHICSKRIVAPHPTILFETPPIKTETPQWGTSHLKMKPPHLKNTDLLKREAPFHEMIPKKSTIKNNLKSA